MKAVVLARVSRGERTQDPETQVAALTAAAARHGWEVVEVVRQVKSGWDDKMAAEVQAAALAPIVAGRASVLMVWALDRLLRTGPAGAFRFMATLEDHYGGSLFSLQEPFLSTASDKSTRQLLLPIIAWVANQESQRRSDRLKAKADFKQQAAQKLGQRALWGRGAMASDLDRKRIHDLRTGGATIRAISKELGLSVGSIHRTLQVPPQTEEQEQADTEKAGPAGGAGLEQARPALSEVADGASGTVAVRKPAGDSEQPRKAYCVPCHEVPAVPHACANQVPKEEP